MLTVHMVENLQFDRVFIPSYSIVFSCLIISSISKVKLYINVRGYLFLHYLILYDHFS